MSTTLPNYKDMAFRLYELALHTATYTCHHEEKKQHLLSEIEAALVHAQRVGESVGKGIIEPETATTPWWED